MKNSKIISTSKFIEGKIVTNKEIGIKLGVSEDWIYKRTGIRERIISRNKSTAYLAYNAGLNALNDSGINPQDLGLIIVATTTPDSFMPATACVVQDRIGAGNAICFDVSSGCAGFVYALIIAEQFISSGMVKSALVIGAEVLSKVTDWNDKDTCILFGDGAGAVVLGATEEKGISNCYLASDGSNSKILTLPTLLNSTSASAKKSVKSIIKMNGKEIYKFATIILPKCVNKVLEDANTSIDEIKYIVPHQANLRIINTSANKLGIDINKFYINLERFGNTYCASIPIALDDMNKEGLLNKGDKLILAGYGGGLTWGSLMVKW